MEDKISLYADDALLYLGDTMANNMSLAEQFGRLSGFAINWTKFVLTPLVKTGLDSSRESQHGQDGMGPTNTYALHNSPLWIPRKWFTCMDTQFRKLIWKKQSARIKLTMLEYG